MFKPYFIPGLLWLIVSTVLLTLPGSNLPKAQWLDTIYFDKWVHIGMFTLMVVLWNWGFMKTGKTTSLKRIFVITAIMAVLYGILMEFVQKYFVPGRSCDIKDMLADAAGSGVGLVYCIGRYIKK